MQDRYGRCVTCGNHAGPECCPRCHEMMAHLQTDQLYVIRRGVSPRGNFVDRPVARQWARR